jgi:hypothetical protein
MERTKAEQNCAEESCHREVFQETKYTKYTHESAHFKKCIQQGTCIRCQNKRYFGRNGRAWSKEMAHKTKKKKKTAKTEQKKKKKKKKKKRKNSERTDLAGVEPGPVPVRAHAVELLAHPPPDRIVLGSVVLLR